MIRTLVLVLLWAYQGCPDVTKQQPRDAGAEQEEP